MYIKEKYIDLMERCFEAYDEERIARYVDEVKREGLKEHGFARLASNLGILIANGRKTEYIGRFIEIMDICCENMPTTKAANDFTVKEVIFCIMALEEKGIFSEKTAYWRECLATVTPEKTYNVIAKKPTDKVHNWACFSAVSEFMRQYIGLADTLEFVDIQIPTQLQWLDENGMYRDPNEPMVYDLVPRGLFALLMHFGYSGKYRAEVDECLRRSGLLTLKMQSVTGEIPYGGRSNQFPHNEAHLAVVCEYEACRYAKLGDTETASLFKRAVEKALNSIEIWLSREPIRHVKNRYPTETGYGCENYAYFDKYMITTASFLYAACLVCDESIPCATQDGETVYTAVTSEHFHKIFLRSGDYFAEIDTFADPHYDCSGIGRIHKKGAPSVICLSCPGTATPNFSLDGAEADFAICPGIETESGLRFATSRECGYRIIERGTEDEKAFCRLECTVDGYRLETYCSLTSDGAEITVKGDGRVAVMLPALDFDGETGTETVCGLHRLTVDYHGYSCRYLTDGELADTGKNGGNRNGVYDIFAATKDNCVTVKIEIYKN